MKQIIWSDFSEEDYSNNIKYLLNEWTINEATNFVDSVTTCLAIISASPEIFPDKKGDGFRSVVIVPQVTLYYKIHKDYIQLHRFWNNYQNPKSLKY